MKINLLHIFSIGIGGFAGAVARHYSAIFIQGLKSDSKFPYGILFVNILGSFLIGFLAGIIESKATFNDNIKLMIFSGFLGAFTTFSTFSKNTFDLLQSGNILSAFLNIIISVTLGLFAVWVGLWLSGKV